METVITQFLQELIYLLIPVIMGYIVNLLHKVLGSAKMKKIEQQLQTHQALAKLIVSAIQETYKTLNGSEKLAIATKSLSDLLAKKGIKLTADEIDVLIHSCLKELKNDFVTTWDNEINDNKVAEENQDQPQQQYKI